MTEHWVIDGYNLLNAYPESHPGRPKPTRENFLIALAGFASTRHASVQVVLDGTGSPAELDVYRTRHFTVIYSLEVSADTRIERTLYEAADPSRWNVVTNDRAIAAIARGKGASVVSCAEFYRTWKESVASEEEIRQRDQAKAHGFNRPFEDKLKDFGK